MTHRRQQIVHAIAAFVILLQSANAQPPASPSTPPKKLQVKGEIRYVGPDTYILLDTDGRPQPVLGMTYEEFVAAWKKLQEVEARVDKPRYTIEALRISGETHDDHAELNVEATVRSHADGSFKLLLGMASAILREQPQIKTVDGATSSASDGCLIDYVPESGGFVATLEGEPQVRRTLSFQVLVPLVRDGNQTNLRLNVPRALVSEFSLAVPTPIIEATATNGTLLTKREITDAGTRLSVIGLAGDFQLNWSVAETERPELATVLSATGAVAISIDGHSIRSDAQLTVRSYGGSFDRFRVRLPPGAKLTQDRPRAADADSPSYRMTVDETTSARDGSQFVTVELAEKQLGPVEIELSTEQPLGLASDKPTVELAGFEVLGAVRQFGGVAIQVADDWHLRWEHGQYVRQVERADLPPPLDKLPATAAFQYDRQPWSLPAQIIARPMVVHVTPKYELKLGTDDADLQVNLDFQVPGARTFAFRVQLAGWELTLDPLESNGLVDRDGVLVTRDGMLVLPLLQASPRRAEISFGLRRTLERSTKQLALPLPVPEADTVAAAELTVVADSGIELRPDMTKSRGLSPTPVTDETVAANADGGAQVFRYRSFAPDAVYAATRLTRPSEVSAEIETAIVLDWQRLRATQKIAYRVAYQPLEELVLEVPSGWSLVDNQIEILSETPDAEPVVVTAKFESGSQDRSKSAFRARLPQPRLGRFAVRLAYEIAESTETPGVGRNVVSLPQPVGARIVAHRARVDSPPSIQVSLAESADAGWQEMESIGSDSPLVVLATSAQTVLPLTLEPATPNRPQAIAVDRVWLQTWQAGDTIQDRVTFRFRAAGPEVSVELPPSVVVQEVEVLADGKLADVSTRQEGRIMVGLPRLATGNEQAKPTHTLELRYRRSAPVGLVARHEFTPPQLVGSSALSEMVWQVVLPGDRHIVRSPGQLVAVEARQSLEIFLGRSPAKTQADLEKWVGATAQLAPSDSQNTYLFSGLAPVASIEVLTAPRWLLVLVASGAVLALASAWMYLPAVRRGWIGILLAILVAGLAVAYPRPAVLMGQASVLGVVLGAIALLLRQRLASPAARPSTTGGSTNIRLPSSLRTDSYILSPLGTTGSGTPTTPLSVPEVNQ